MILTMTMLQAAADGDSTILTLHSIESPADVVILEFVFC